MGFGARGDWCVVGGYKGGDSVVRLRKGGEGAGGKVGGE